MTLEAEIKNHILDIPNFPIEGIIFKDICPIFSNPLLVKKIINQLVNYYQNKNIDAVAGLDARGFLLGPMLALELDVPFILIRKSGKLPGKTLKQIYNLEYGSASVEIQENLLKEGMNVLIHDDVLATGGTAAAAAFLIQQKANVAGFNFLINLSFLNGEDKIKNIQNDIYSLITY